MSDSSATSDPIARDAKGNEFRLRSIDCPTCRVRNVKIMGLRGGATHRYGLGVETSIVQCRQCGLMFPDPFPYPLRSDKLYGDPEKYFVGHDEGEKVTSCRTLVRSLAARVNAVNPNILDVGSGRGELLRAAKLEGIREAIGLEFAPAMIEYARAAGVKLVPQTIEEYCRTGDKFFDIITLNAVLEHVYDPDSMVDCVARLLRPGGVVYIDVPREPNLLTYVGNSVNRLRGSKAVFNLSPTFPPFHVFGFNPRAVRRLLTKHRLVVEKLEVRSGVYVPATGGIKDRIRAFGASQILRVANHVQLAANMFVWAARRVEGASGP